MKPSVFTDEQRKAALAAGIAIVVMTIAATIANDFTIGKLVVEGNVVETMRNILASKTTFNVGILSWIIILVCDVDAAWGLYIFLKPANQHQSLIAAWFRLIYAAMLAAAIFNLVNVHILIHQAVPFNIQGNSNDYHLTSDPFPDNIPTSWSLGKAIVASSSFHRSSQKNPSIPFSSPLLTIAIQYIS